MKNCGGCHRQLDFSEFYKNKARHDGYQSQCKQCGYKSQRNYVKTHRAEAVQRVLRYKARNPDKAKATALKTRLKYKNQIAAQRKVYLQNHLKEHANRMQRRRAIIKNNGVYLISDKEIKKLYSSPCTYCGSFINITVDHIIPIIKGGTHSIGNLTAACKPCNSSKHKDFLTVWKKRKGRNQIERPRDGY